MATGIRQRHGRSCEHKPHCSCPWEAGVYSATDGRKIRKTFPTYVEAVAWRSDARGSLQAARRVRNRRSALVNRLPLSWPNLSLAQAGEMFGLSLEQVVWRLSPKPRKSIPQDVRMTVFQRDRFRCRECGSTENLTVDHIKPRARLGQDELSNYQTLCGRCNSKKGTR